MVKTIETRDEYLIRMARSAVQMPSRTRRMMGGKVRKYLEKNLYSHEDQDEYFFEWCKYVYGTRPLYDVNGNQIKENPIW